MGSRNPTLSVPPFLFLYVQFKLSRVINHSCKCAYTRGMFPDRRDTEIKPSCVSRASWTQEGIPTVSPPKDPFCACLHLRNPSAHSHISSFGSLASLCASQRCWTPDTAFLPLPCLLTLLQADST